MQKSFFSNFKKNLILSKKYWIVYVVIIVLVFLSMASVANYQHPKMEILILILCSVLGIFCIAYYWGHNDDKELHKTVFIVLLMLGLLTSIVIPIDSVSDEGEHLIRAEMTSRGVLFPEYVNGSFESINSMPHFFSQSLDKTVFEVNGDTDKINYSLDHVDSAFEQNPFFGYIFSGFGVLVAKLLDLNVIWMLWLARIFNSLFYSFVISYSIKKTPIFKMPLFFISCLPVCLFQAFSVSIDSIVAGLGILIVSLFISIFKNEFSIKEILIFSLLCLIVGLCKLPYLALILLLFFLPKNHFKQKNYHFYCLFSVFAIGLIGILWSKFYATSALMHSWRGIYLAENNVNINNQISFLLSHPLDLFNVIFNIFNSVNYIFNGFFSFYSYSVDGGVYNASGLLSLLVLVSFFAICFTYPINEKIDLKYRIGALLTFIIIYFGTFIVQLLSWTSVGNLNITGVHTRYFLPLFALLPLSLSFNIINLNKENYDKKVFILILVFGVSMIMSLIIKYY